MRRSHRREPQAAIYTVTAVMSPHKSTSWTAMPPVEDTEPAVADRGKPHSR
jgi:hypothetical protein